MKRLGSLISAAGEKCVPERSLTVTVNCRQEYSVELYFLLSTFRSGLWVEISVLITELFED